MLLNPKTKTLIRISKDILSKELTREEKKKLSEDIFYRLLFIPKDVFGLRSGVYSLNSFNSAFASLISDKLIYLAFLLDSEKFLSEVDEDLERYLTFALVYSHDETSLLNSLIKEIISKRKIDYDKINYKIGYLFGKNLNLFDNLTPHRTVFYIISVYELKVLEVVTDPYNLDYIKNISSSLSFATGLLEAVKDRRPTEKSIKIVASLCYYYLLDNIENLPEGKFIEKLKSYLLVNSI